MTAVARITFSHGGGLILPASTPYDRQLLFEHVAQYAKQHGHVQLGVNRGEWTVARVDDAPQACAICHQRPSSVAYTRSGSTVCHLCARVALPNWRRFDRSRSSPVFS